MLGGGGAELLEQVKYLIVPYTRGKGVELGRGSYKAFPHFIGVRERSDTTQLSSVPADLPCDTFVQGLQMIQDDSLDFVFAWGIDYTTNIADEVARVLKIGGHVVLAGVTDRTFGETRREVALEMMERVDINGIVSYVIAEPLKPQGKTACIVRYGAFGDTLQSTSILDELKREGYHITWMCEPVGEELLRHDPRIDAFIVQDKDQVPNQDLPKYWAVQRKRFDRWINLCESVEGTLIKLPGRADFHFPDAVRRELCAHNYVEFTAKLAQLEFHSEYRFFASAEEIDKATDYRYGIRTAHNAGNQIGTRDVEPFVIMWALSGSSTHKSYPHMDAVVARVLTEIPHAHFVLVGDAACQILEVGWENEPRVHRESGKLPIRDTLALAQMCDLVIGPETGVMNAVAFESMPKVLFLSHSSELNLSRDWVNTESLHGDVPCYPCHRLHYTAEYCPRHPETHAAMCAQEILPGTVWEAIQRGFVGRETVKRILTP